MADIKASDVSKLRKMTGAGMMDCKKALQESGGDFDAAIEYIRKKGQAVANKRADKEATEGVVLAKESADKKTAVMVCLNCETDFVAKNQKFVDFVQSIVDVALENLPENLDELGKLPLDGATVNDQVNEQIGVIGEKIGLAFYVKLQAESTVSYVHPGNQLATIVGFNKGGVDTQVMKDIAMQVAAMNPVSLDKDDVPREVVDREIEIGKDQARQEGKPENLLEKIAMGKLNKFFKESTLLNQDFVKENKKTIKQYLQETDKELKVTAFTRYSLRD